MERLKRSNFSSACVLPMASFIISVDSLACSVYRNAIYPHNISSEFHAALSRKRPCRSRFVGVIRNTEQMFAVQDFDCTDLNPTRNHGDETCKNTLGSSSSAILSTRLQSSMDYKGNYPETCC